MSEIFMPLVWYYDISLYDGANRITKYMLGNFCTCRDKAISWFFYTTNL